MNTLQKYLPQALKTLIKESSAYKFLLTRQLFISGGGQDLWVIGEVFNGARDGFYLDIGAHDGVEHSNTYRLERRYGWKGICIEGNPDTFTKLIKNRKCNCVEACLDSTEQVVEFAKKGEIGGIVLHENKNQVNSLDVIKIQTRTLQSVLEEFNAPEEMDYLSIDIEGAEDRVLREFDFTSYRFKCITIERPSESLRAILKKNGYSLIRDVKFLVAHYVHESYLSQYEKNFFSFYRRRIFKAFFR
jgi:FkbM family methyltransferase